MTKATGAQVDSPDFPPGDMAVPVEEWSRVLSSLRDAIVAQGTRLLAIEARLGLGAAPPVDGRDSTHRETLDALEDAVCVLDAGRITFANVAAGRLLGGEASSLRGKLWDELSPPTGDAPSLWQEFIDTRAARRSVWLRRLDGETVSAFAALTALSGEGRPGAGVLVLRIARAQPAVVAPQGELSERARSDRTSGASSAVPQSTRAAQPAAPRAALPATRSAVTRVLVVDDNELNQRLLASTFIPLGFQVTAVGSGREALAQCATKQYDLIVLDCQMPEVDGYQTAAALRARPGCERVPIIAVTANVTDGDRERCLAAGMNDYITKPFSLSALRITALKWLSGEAGRAPAIAPDVVRGSRFESDDDEVLDLARLRSITGAVGLSIQELSSLFTEDAAARLVKLSAAAERADHNTVRRQAHAVTGAAGNLGATRVARLARELENVTSSSGPAELTAMVSRLCDEVAKVDLKLEELRRAGISGA